jgi:DNA replication protein DnaC
VEHWHEALGDPTLADAILDRLVHNAYTIALHGDSLRKRQAQLPPQALAEQSGRSCDGKL